MRQKPSEPERSDALAHDPGIHLEPAGRSPPARRYHSSDLFGEGRAVVIEHAGKEYSLLITRQGKLLLNRSV